MNRNLVESTFDYTWTKLVRIRVIIYNTKSCIIKRKSPSRGVIYGCMHAWVSWRHARKLKIGSLFAMEVGSWNINEQTKTTDQHQSPKFESIWLFWTKFGGWIGWESQSLVVEPT